MARTTTAKPLILTQYAESSATTEYTTPSNSKSLIDKFTATNITGGALTVNIWLLPNGQTVGNEYLVIDTFSIAANTCKDFTELANQYLDTGEAIAVQASAASSIIIRCSGREVVTS